MGLGTYTDHERTLQCLVDGYNRKHGRDVALPAMVDAVSTIAEAMEGRGWPYDASRLRLALRTPDEGLRAERAGQELLCQGSHLIRKDSTGAVLAFVASLARYWPTAAP